MLQLHEKSSQQSIRYQRYKTWLTPTYMKTNGKECTDYIAIEQNNDYKILQL